MEKKRLLIGLFVFTLLIGIVQASTLKVNVLTLEDHKLDINFLDAEKDTPSSVYHFYNDTGDGQFSFEVSADTDSFNIHTYLIKDGNTIKYGVFEDVPSGQEIQLLLLPGTSEITENYEEESSAPAGENSGNQSSANETTAGQNEIETVSGANESQSNVSSSKVGGFAVVNEALDIFTNKVFYYVGLIIVLGLVGFMIARRVYKKGNLKFKMPERKDSDTGFSRGTGKEDKIETMRKKLIEDEKELMKLRKEEKDKEEEKKK